MHSTTLGKTGLIVSRFALGVNFGIKWANFDNYMGGRTGMSMQGNVREVW